MDSLLTYYDNQDEDKRLNLDRAHSLEYLTTIKYLDIICLDKSTVLDACAGTGVYSFYLAEKGNVVTAGDIVPNNVELIQKKQENNPILHDIYTGDILDLSRFEDKSFDVVLCLGAFYHLHNEEERLQAISECSRVLKTGGVIVIAYLNRFASFIHNLKSNPHNVSNLLNEYYSGSRNIFYRSTPSEIERLAEQCQLIKRYNVSTDGLSFLLVNELEEMSNDEFDIFLRYHFDSCENKNILGYSLHGLYVGEKRW